MTQPTAVDCNIDAVYFAQTHVLEPSHPYFRLIGGRNALIKVHVLSPSGAKAPKVEVELELDEDKTVIELRGPENLPTSFEKAPGKVVHSFEDCFTATIPGQWIRKGLNVRVQAGNQEMVFEKLFIGPPLKLNASFFDIHFFGLEDADWPENWVEEIAIRRPLTSMKVQRTKKLVFDEAVIKPNGGAPAIRCTSPEDYESQTGSKINGHQGTVFEWSRALRDAGGQKNVSLVYIAIGNLRCGGFAEPLHGCGSLERYGLLHHEMGHALDVEDLTATEEPLFPYRGKMHGIDKTDTGGYHVGPTWGYDHRIGLCEKYKDTPMFINPVEGVGTHKDKVGEWKHSPVRGGAGFETEAPSTFNMFSDWSVRKKQVFLERRLLKWEEEESAYRKWNDYWDDHRNLFKNDGVAAPIEHEVEVYSILVNASAVTPDANFIYPLIGPYRSGLIATFDPEKPEDRKRASRLQNFAEGWDLCLRVTQGGKTKTYMMGLAWKLDDDPLEVSSLKVRALNLPVQDGEVTKAELLLTPDVNIEGLPADPKVLYSRDMSLAPVEVVETYVDFEEGDS